MTKPTHQLRHLVTLTSRLFLATALWLLLAGTALASTWTTVTVDNATNVSGKYCSMAADPAGKLHIGYMDYNSLDTTTSFPILKYATNVDGSWVVESLQAYVANITLASTSTVYTPSGPRIMAYSNNLETGEFKYQAARKIIGDGWQLQDIAGGKFPPEMGGADQPPIMAIHPETRTGAIQHQGFTFITYSDGDTLWYANERDMYYYPFQGAGSGNQSNLAVDSNGDMNIIYYNPTTTQDFEQGLMYALNNNAPVSLVSGVVSYPTIAIDAADTIHVVYLDASFNIRYMNKTAGGGWSTPAVVANAGYLGGHLSLAKDSAGGLHLAYYGHYANNKDYLYYMSRSVAGVWSTPEQIPAITQSNDYGQFAALVVGQNNNVSISYYDVKRSKLCVAQKVTPAINVSPEPVYFGNVQLGDAATQVISVKNRGLADLVLSGTPSLTGAGAGEFSIIANSCTNGLLLTPGSAGCAVSVQLTPGSPGAKTADLIIGSNDAVNPVKALELRGMSYTPADSFTISASAGIGGTISPSGEVSVAGGSNQSFIITPAPGFLVGSVSVNGISVGTLTSYDFVEVSADASIAATFTSIVPVATWEITEVDNISGVDTGKYCSIDNDEDGNIYVGYMDTSLATPLLKYVTNAGGSWSTPEQVPMADVTNAGTATVFSEGIGPRIMAYTYDGTTRKYAAERKWTEQAPTGGNLNDWQLQYIAGDIWPPETPFGMGGTAQLPIFNLTEDTFTGAVQSDGYTFITFSDGNNLWYANEKDFYYLKLDETNSIPGAGKQSDLVLDSLNDIHIVYYTPGASGLGELHYGNGHGGYMDPVNNPPVYTESVLVNGVVSDPGIAIDSEDTLHVSYIQDDRVKYLNGTLVEGVRTWSEPYDLGPCGSAGAYLSMEANGLDILHLSYYSNNGNGTGSLMYAQRTANGVWSIPAPVWAPTEAPASDYGQYAALVVDDNHNVNIAYYDVTRSSLKVAKKLIPVISTSAASLNFGYVNEGQQASQTVTVSNNGQSTLRIGTAVLTGANAAEYSITADSCSGVSLADTITSCDITVVFTPASFGVKTAVLNLPSDDPYTPIKQVSLVGSSESVLYTITASADLHGTITPAGEVYVAQGENQSFTIVPDAGLFVADVLVDGLSVGPVTSYSFDNVIADHSIEVSFASYIRVASVYFGTLQDAYNASSGLPVQIRAVTLSEGLSCDLPVTVELQGGYDAAFQNQTGGTALTGALGISDGGVEVENLGLE